MPPESPPTRILSLARAFYNVKVLEPLILKKLGIGVLAATPETFSRRLLILAYALANLKVS